VTHPRCEGETDCRAAIRGKEARSPMTVQETAFRTYYASLTDAELLWISANKRSYIAVAQEALDRELKRRSLERDEGTVAPHEGAGGV
jgi:hypothetical protein